MILDDLQLNPAKAINEHPYIVALVKFTGCFFAFSTFKNLFYTLESAIKAPFISYLSTPEGWELDTSITKLYLSLDGRGSGR